MQRNKIVAKQVKPKVIVISSAVLIMLAGIAFFNKNPKVLKEKHKTEKNPVMIFNIVSVSFIAYILICSLIPLYKKGNAFATESAQKYLGILMEQHPEFNQYKSVLKNQQAMKQIATMISNELRNSEQKRILELVNKINLDSTEEQIEKIHKEIAKVSEEHSTIHPEFLEHVYGALVNADYMMYVKQKQQENKIKTR